MNVLTASAGLAVLGTCLLAIDGRVREQAMSIVTGCGATGDLGSSAVHVQHTVESTLRTLEAQGLAYGPLTAFGVAAIVLVLFMTRT